MPQRVEELADRLRQLSPAIAVEVTEVFLERNPDWRTRYGARAVTHGVQDAGYHLAFLASAVESADVEPFIAYARWTARVLGSRGMASRFLAENLEQVRDAIARRVSPEQTALLNPYFTAALGALADAPAPPPALTLPLTATVFLEAILSGQRAAAVQIAREA